MNNTNNFGRWGRVGSLPIETVCDMILTNSTPTTFGPSEHLFEKIGKPEEPLRVLDFGCGAARNIVGMLKYSPNWMITGYDNPKMIERGIELFGEVLHSAPNVTLSSDWSQVCTKKFDTIACCLVLQHIDEEEIIRYINDFKNIADTLIVAGRRSLDELNTDKTRKSVWKILESHIGAPEWCDSPKIYNLSGPQDHFTCKYALRSAA